MSDDQHDIFEIVDFVRNLDGAGESYVLPKGQKTKKIIQGSKHYPPIDYIKVATINVEERYPEIRYDHVLESELDPGFIIGTWAFSKPGVVRYILARDLEMARGVLPGDVTRAWINDQFNPPFKRRRAQLGECYSTPLLARRGEWGECSYVDIRQAYVRILSLGYDLEYERMRYIAADPVPVPDVIKNNKFCYAMAVSMSHNKISSIDVMGRNGIFTTHPFNLYSNPCLFNLAMDTLAAMAAEVLEVMGEDVKYINTDGYIVPSEVAGTVQHILLSWGFESRIKHQGETIVWGVGSYKCGDRKTARRDKNSMDFQSTLPTKQERDWLKRDWSIWSKYL